MVLDYENLYRFIFDLNADKHSAEQISQRVKIKFHIDITKKRILQILYYPQVIHTWQLKSLGL